MGIANCVSLNVIGIHNLIGTGTIRIYGFVGVGMASLEEVCQCGGGLGSLLLKLPSVLQSSSCYLKM